MAESASDGEGGAVPERRLLPPFAFLGALVALGAIDRLVPLGDPDLPWALRALGGLVTALAVVLAFAARGRFERAGTGVVPFSPATALVTDGPFRFSRNPMYLAMVAALAGIALALGSVAVWLVPILFWLWLRQSFVLPEEAFMAAHFGQAYADYCRRVRRWL